MALFQGEVRERRSTLLQICIGWSPECKSILHDQQTPTYSCKIAQDPDLINAVFPSHKVTIKCPKM